MRTPRLFAALASLALLAALLLVHRRADADALVVTTGYPRHPLSTNAALVARTDCAQPLEHWQFAFGIPAATYTDLVVYARSGSSGSCADPAARTGGSPACRRVAAFPRASVTSGQIVTIPSAAMVHALADGVDVDPAASLDCEAICYPAADEVPQPFVLSALLFDGASLVIDGGGGAYEATTALKFDRRGPAAPTAIALTATGNALDVSYSLDAPSADARAVVAYCFTLPDVDANAACALPAGMLHAHDLLGLSVEGSVCATAPLGASSLHVADSIPGQTYAVSLVVTDSAGNSGPISPLQCLTISKKPEVLEDTAPSEAPPPVSTCVCSAAGRHGPSGPPELPLFPLLALLAPLAWLARRTLRAGLPQTRRARTV